METPRSVQQYDDAMNEQLQRFYALCSKQGGDMQIAVGIFTG